MSSTASALPAAVSPVEPDWLAEAERIRDLYHAEPTSPPSILGDAFKVNRLLKAVADGNYRTTAAMIAGFTRQTLYNLEQHAKTGYIPAIALFDSIEKAEAHAEGEMVGCIRGAAKAGHQYWAAGMTYLERRQPDRWGKRQDDSSVPKVVVQIGTAQGDISVSLSPSPQSVQGESRQIPSVILSESDKLDYVNQPKSLTAQTIDVPERNTSEGPATQTGSPRRADRKGTLPRSVASRARTGRVKTKGGA